MVDISFYVIQPLLANIKTGNVWHDCLLIIVVLFCITCISKFCNYGTDKFQSFIGSISWRRFKARYSINIVVNPNCSLNTRMQVPEEYLGLLHHLHTTNVNICSAKFIPLSKSRMKTADDFDELLNYFITTTGKHDLLIAPQIYLRIQKGQLPNSKDYFFSDRLLGILHYKITIYSYKLTLKQLKEMINQWTTNYREYIKQKTKGNFYHLTYLKMTHPLNQKAGVEFNKHLFSTSKSFDNLFFEGKQMLIDRLNFFLNNSNFYQQRGIAYSLGLLFYGTPGCGKTSMIKAIASYTKRHIVEIPLSRIRTCEELKQAFFLDSYDKVDLDFADKIIVFEDIDCMSHIIKKRSTTNVTTAGPLPTVEGDDIFIQLEQVDIDARKKKMSKQSLRTLLDNDSMASKDPLTLSFLLNLIDGIIEQPSRILIMTSNHPEEIDPALLRPGRVDIQQEFKRCTTSIIKEMIEFFFNEKDQIDVSQLKDYVYSPADIISICMSTSNGKSAVQLLAEQPLPNLVIEAEKTLEFSSNKGL